MEVCCYRCQNLASYQGIRLNDATDIDEKNIEYARSNIIRNNLKPRIRPLRTKPTDSLIPLDALGLERCVSINLLE